MSGPSLVVRNNLHILKNVDTCDLKQNTNLSDEVPSTPEMSANKSLDDSHHNHDVTNKIIASEDTDQVPSASIPLNGTFRSSFIILFK